MSEKDQGKRSFINEQIVPRKNFKKALLVVGLVIVLGVVFGAIAGITFFVSQNVMGKNIVQESQPEAIIIARDDTEEASRETKKQTEKESTSPEETMSETAEESSSEEEPASESQTPEEETEDGKKKEEAPTEPEKPTLQSVYANVSNGFVTIAIMEPGDVDWFDQTIFNREERFGVIIAETGENMFILMEGNDITEDAEIRVHFSEGSSKAEFYGYDSLTGLTVLRIKKKELVNVSYQLVPLGNSFLLETASEIYMVGAPFNKPIAVDKGIITLCEREADVQDGYEHLFYTDMLRAPGGSAAILNENSEIIGWVSDYSCGDDNNVVVCGISPLKYVIEDLCSGQSTAYVGVHCVTVNADDALELGMDEGLYVREVEPYSPAYEAGIQTGDRIVAINGKVVFSGHSLQNRIDSLRSGSTVQVTVERRGVDQYEPVTLNLTLGER